VITESSSDTTRTTMSITHSPSVQEKRRTLQIIQGSQSYAVDMSSMEFHESHESLDLGGVKLGRATFRAQLQASDHWVDLDAQSDDPAIKAGGHELGDYLRKIEGNPERAARLANARKRIAQSLSNAHNGGLANSLAELRMRGGMSQSQLAQKMNTQQPGVARWERSPKAMQFETMKMMADALGIGVSEVASVIDRQMNSSEVVHAD